MDGIFGTWDDGLRLTIDSNCIDAADGDAAPSTDICGLKRFNHRDVVNEGTGEPNYVEIGAYEVGPRVVVMCWIDESDNAYYSTTDPNCEERFNDDLAKYRNLVDSGKFEIVKSGCLAPLPKGPGVPPPFRTIEGVLPYNYFDPPVPESVSVEDPPEGISIYEFPRTNPDPNRDDFINHFNRICDGMVPDYLCLSVDNSGSMYTSIIEPGYSEADPNFIGWIKTKYPDTIIKRRDVAPPDPDAFTNERWVDEMRIQIQNVVDDL
ncbi:hypothetical protein ES703_93471 [subsurface metagenome]